MGLQGIAGWPLGGHHGMEEERPAGVVVSEGNGMTQSFLRALLWRPWEALEKEGRSGELFLGTEDSELDLPIWTHKPWPPHPAIRSHLPGPPTWGLPG